MKAIRFLNLVAIGLTLSIAATGCKTHPQRPTNIPGHKEKTEITDAFAPPIDRPGISDSNMIALPDERKHVGWTENADAFKSQTVHFAFDSSAVKADDKEKVAAVADQLKGNAKEAVRVEGNCDERGTEEYNRSLGERRALAVREELIRLGIEPSRVDTLSYGEDRPAADGHDESAWKQNRRAEFILLTPPTTP